MSNHETNTIRNPVADLIEAPSRAAPTQLEVLKENRKGSVNHKSRLKWYILIVLLIFSASIWTLLGGEVTIHGGFSLTL